MKILTTLVALALAFTLHARDLNETPADSLVSSEDSQKGKSLVEFAYDLDFELDFDNREYDKSAYAKSMTIFGARLTPAIGLNVNQKNLRHQVMIGIDIMKDFGASPVAPEIAGDGSDETSQRLNNWNLFRELSLYYRLNGRFGKTEMTLTAGVFPRRFSQVDWPESFCSDSLKFYDNNLEGILLSFKRPSAYYEVGCDWMGMYGKDRRERFMIFTSGKASLLKWLDIGYYAYLYHMANSGSVGGVVDNVLINPYLTFDFSDFAGIQRLGLSLGWLQSLQQDRKNIGEFVFPGGGELTAEVRNWDAGLKYKLFYGSDMMPYYNSNDSGGFKYGNMLYMGDPFYRVRQNGHSGAYHRLEAYYEPVIGGFVSIRVAVVLHFNESFSGWQQMVGLRFNLNDLLTNLEKRKNIRNR